MAASAPSAGSRNCGIQDVLSSRENGLHERFIRPVSHIPERSGSCTTVLLVSGGEPAAGDQPGRRAAHAGRSSRKGAPTASAGPGAADLDRDADPAADGADVRRPAGIRGQDACDRAPLARMSLPRVDDGRDAFAADARDRASGRRRGRSRARIPARARNRLVAALPDKRATRRRSRQVCAPMRPRGVVHGESAL